MKECKLVKHEKAYKCIGMGNVGELFQKKFTLHFRNLSVYETRLNSNESFLKVKSGNFEN